jgi:hypothetical protein
VAERGFEHQGKAVVSETTSLGSMDQSVVTLHNPSVSLDFESGQMEVTGHLIWKNGPHPEVVWVWAYFLNPREALPAGPGSRSNPPIKLLQPLRHSTAADIVARGHFHWWNNPDVPRDGYLAHVFVAAASSTDAQVPVRSRDYNPANAIPVQIRSVPAPASQRAEVRAERSLSRKYEVALSFAGEDREYVDKVARLLQAAGVEVFYDRFEEVELWGKNLTDLLAEIYAKQSEFVVLFVSAHYATKAWPNHERKHALARTVQQGTDSILPARFDDTELPGLPDTVAYVDLRATTPERLAEMIKQKVRNSPEFRDGPDTDPGKPRPRRGEG